MSSLVNASDYLAQRTGGTYEDLFFQKNGQLGGAAAPACIAGLETSLFRYEGTPDANSGIASGIVATTNTTLGGLQQANPGGSRQKWLTAIEAFIAQNSSSTMATGTLCLYDRLLHVASLDGTLTSPQALQGVSSAFTATITIASPAVITATAHGYGIGQKVRFTTTGALPTGLTVGTDYFVISAGYGANTFEVSTSIGGSAVNTSGTQSGTHTVTGQLGAQLSRYTDGLGVELWIEILTQIGASATTVQAAYLDEGSNASNTVAATIGGTSFREKARIIRLPRGAGDKGILSASTITLAATTGTAGNIAVVFAKPLCELEIVKGGVAAFRSFMQGQPGPIEILTNACLAFSWIAGVTAVPNVSGFLHMVEK
jgi:hypothetical protein